VPLGRTPAAALATATPPPIASSCAACLCLRLHYHLPLPPPGPQGAPVYIPSALLRSIAFKLTADLAQVPALNELTRAALRLLLNGDASEWDRALQMPHYAAASMPAISLHAGAHLMQLMANGARFTLFDYGSPAANAARYGTPQPPDVAAHYALLRGLPVDLVAGRSDGVVALEDVGAHYAAMQGAGLEVSYKEMEVGHLDVTFGVKDEVVQYVLRRLGLTRAR
jgi:lysosomal acid lipase/cholesteryl ester hydrolase